jgi:hypothetical protein
MIVDSYIQWFGIVIPSALIIGSCFYLWLIRNPMFHAQLSLKLLKKGKLRQAIDAAYTNIFSYNTITKVDCFIKELNRNNYLNDEGGLSFGIAVLTATIPYKNTLDSRKILYDSIWLHMFVRGIGSGPALAGLE